MRSALVASFAFSAMVTATLLSTPNSALAVTAGNSIGQKVVSLSGTDVLGKQVSLESLRGKFAMVVFWDPDCHTCMEEVPMYDEYYRKLGQKRFGIVSVMLSRNRTEKQMQDEVNKHGLSFPVIGVSGEKLKKLALQWDVRATPANYLVNPDGVIVLKGFLGPEGMTLMDEIIRKQPDFVPPQMDVQTSLDGGGSMAKFEVAIPQATASQYDFRFRAWGYFVGDDGQPGEFEEIAPVKVRVSGKASNGSSPETALESADRSGESAQLSAPSLVKTNAKMVGNVLRLEVSLPLPHPAQSVLGEVNYYSKELGAYIPIELGFTS